MPGLVRASSRSHSACYWEDRAGWLQAYPSGANKKHVKISSCKDFKTYFRKYHYPPTPHEHIFTCFFGPWAMVERIGWFQSRAYSITVLIDGLISNILRIHVCSIHEIPFNLRMLSLRFVCCDYDCRIASRACGSMVELNCVLLSSKSRRQICIQHRPMEGRIRADRARLAHNKEQERTVSRQERTVRL